MGIYLQDYETKRELSPKFGSVERLVDWASKQVHKKAREECKQLLRMAPEYLSFRANDFSCLIVYGKAPQNVKHELEHFFLGHYWFAYLPWHTFSEYTNRKLHFDSFEQYEGGTKAISWIILHEDMRPVEHSKCTADTITGYRIQSEPEKDFPIFASPSDAVWFLGWHYSKKLCERVLDVIKSHPDNFFDLYKLNKAFSYDDSIADPLADSDSTELFTEGFDVGLPYRVEFYTCGIDSMCASFGTGDRTTSVFVDPVHKYVAERILDQAPVDKVIDLDAWEEWKWGVDIKKYRIVPVKAHPKDIYHPPRRKEFWLTIKHNDRLITTDSTPHVDQIITTLTTYIARLAAEELFQKFMLMVSRSTLADGLVEIIRSADSLRNILHVADIEVLGSWLDNKFLYGGLMEDSAPEELHSLKQLEDAVGKSYPVGNTLGRLLGSQSKIITIARL